VIAELWKTSYATTSLTKEQLLPEIDWRETETTHLSQSPELQEAIADRLTKKLVEAVAPAHQTSGQRRVRFEVIGGGTFRGIQYSGGEHALLWTALLNGPMSGQIILQDPRAGAAMVAMPGMPWGGSQAVEMYDGLTLVIPGWLGWSIPSVGAKSHYLTACISLG
jgi:hypothetical protein